MRHMEEYDTIKSTIGELHEKIEVEAGSITQVGTGFGVLVVNVLLCEP